MSISAGHIIVILSPILPWLLKITVSYRIQYYATKKRMDKYFRKNKTPFIRRFFYWDFRESIPSLLFWSNLGIAIILLVSLLLSFIYLVAILAGVPLSNTTIPSVAAYMDLIISVILIIVNITERLGGHK